ncbi:MAG: hypothetical protein ACLQVI_02215 [Polyangiaceae bacterium]
MRRVHRPKEHSSHRGDTASLGRLKRIDPKRVTCRPANAVLTPVPAPVPSGEPIATFE